MARPVKPSDDRRNVMLRLRLTTTEKQQLDMIAKDAGFTVSDLIRKTVLKQKPKSSVPSVDREILLKLLAELNREGNNLNQITRTLNTRVKSGVSPFDGDVSAKLKQLFPYLEGLVRLIHSKIDHGH